MRLRASIWRVCPLAVALPFLILCATPTLAETATRSELEQRVLDVAHMFQNDPRYNRGKTPQQVKDGVEFVTGNVLFVLGHETAHALISEMAIPVLGREEDAADALATIVALKMANSFADRVVVNAARGWFLSDQRDRKEGIPSTFYDEHGMDLQRAYNIVCLLVGGEPDKFSGLAKEVKLPEQRQGTCQGDYSNATWSWEQVLKPHMRKPEDPKTKIEVKYAEAGDYSMLAQIGQKLKILESVAEWLSDDYAWKRPISLEMQQCGSPGARWDLQTRKVVVCYEIIREFSTLYRNYGQMALVPGTIQMSKNKKIILASKPAAKSRSQKAFRSDRSSR
jgi:Putative metallopeptidase